VIHSYGSNSGFRAVAEAMTPTQDQTVLLFVCEDDDLQPLEIDPLQQ
jgi:hypothetical protein